MPEKPEIEALIIESVRQLAGDFELDALKNANAQSLLYGGEGLLDSMALVNLIADLEEAVDAKFGQTIALADEKAMSAKHSPYRSVASLTNAIAERLQS
ncbi:MAG: hypothetical protein ACLFU4_01510 [Opitutales bacterium]